jgi:hypothetical protein
VGTSTTEVYEGQTASRQGRPVATDSHAVSIVSTACTKAESCSIQISTSKVKVNLSATPTADGASLAMTDSPGSLDCAKKGFLETSDVVQVQPAGFSPGSTLAVSEQVEGVPKGSQSAVCLQGSTGPARVLPKCGKSGPAPCVSGTTSSKTADTYDIDLLATELADLYVTNTNAGLAKSIKPTAAGTGATVTVKGKGLPASKDVSISFTGSGGTLVQSPVESGTAKSITTAVPSGAISGPIVLTLIGNKTTSVKSFTLK